MTPRERAAAALELRIPDRVPTFELEFQLEPEMFGRRFLNQDDLRGKSAVERDRMLNENADFMLEVYGKLEYDIIPLHYLAEEELKETARIIRRRTGNQYMLTTHGDGTFALPDGNEMVAFSYRLADEPEALEAEAERMMNEAIERNRRLADAGIDSLILCADYCYNSGPFLSPRHFAWLITPYLKRIIEEARKNGQYTIKHTDGNIMPILDQLVEANPHAIHSLDPMAKVDIAEVKRLVGDKLALCGNVNCALMQTGTEQEVIDSALYALEHGKPGGGYIYCTSNVPFRGLPPERYQLVLDVWKKHREY